MRRRFPLRNSLKWLLAALIILGFFALPTFHLLLAKSEISLAVAHAKSIRLEHYRSGYETRIPGGKDEIFASKQLSPDDFHKVSDAFPICLDGGVPGNELKCIFNPHHRIIITDSSGMVTTIKVCFECDHVGISHGAAEFGNIFGTPFIWMATLRKFFADQGMPNSPELYHHFGPVTAPEASTATNAAPTSAQ